MGLLYNTIAGSLSEQLETDRLLLRPYREGDEGDFLRVLQDNPDRIEAYFPARVAMTRILDDARAQIAQFNTEWGARKTFAFGLWLKDSNYYIGDITLKNIEHKIPKAELGYYLCHTHEGKGYASEALHAVVRFAFEELLMNKLYIRCSPENHRSCTLAERCGFQKEGLIRYDYLIRNNTELIDVNYFGMTRPDYVKQQLATADDSSVPTKVK